MRPEQMTAVTTSFQRLLLREEMLAVLFYQRLFALEPSVKPMFGDDMRAQGRKFVDMVQIVVAGMHDPDLFDAMRALGQRHREYGVRAEHYATVQTALLWALQQALNEHYTIEVEQGWTALYTMVATAMQEGTKDKD